MKQCAMRKIRKLKNCWKRTTRSAKSRSCCVTGTKNCRTITTKMPKSTSSWRRNATFCLSRSRRKRTTLSGSRSGWKCWKRNTPNRLIICMRRTASSRWPTKSTRKRTRKTRTVCGNATKRKSSS
uniref:(northern house mosquito) hypothetical protein n=1 Tax=Culex pipiens TaxID=7175 RepID=A0A8D8KU67_CULPI